MSFPPIWKGKTSRQGAAEEQKMWLIFVQRNNEFYVAIWPPHEPYVLCYLSRAVTS